jgi:glucokinase
MSLDDHPRLLVDVGGTYARFALETEPGKWAYRQSLRVTEYADFHGAVSAYLADVPAQTIRHGAVAIANPVEGDQVRMTNYPWRFSIEQMRERLGLDTLVVVNDFTALAMAIPRLAPTQRRQVGGGVARERSVIGVIGSGTGLGVSGLIPLDDGWFSLGSEGGHTSFAPTDERELAILEHAQRLYGHVSFERLLSGAGLELIHQALCQRQGSPAATAVMPAPEITRRAVAGTDPLCVETVEAFCCMLGTAASNLAVTLGALGGIYIGGGIVPRLGEHFDRSGFRARFESKGRFSEYVAAIPTYVITADHATFLGASAILEAQLRRLGGGGASSMIERVRRLRNELPPAERKVADFVLAHPRQALGGPIADIARAAEVSQPTVIRFCRSLGCEGLSDFKLRLASGLGATVPVTHSVVTHDDSVLEMGAKVLDNTASAILQVRDHLNRDALDEALSRLMACNRVEFYAVGHYGVVAQDAQYKFLRFGKSCAAYTDPRLQRLAAAALTPSEVVVAISPSGRVPELIAAVEIALERGAAVIAITSAQSPLARKASVALLVDYPEDPNTQMPMVGRILNLLVIDILAVGVAMRSSAAELQPAIELDEVATPADSAPRALPRPGPPGVATATNLAHLTSHSGRSRAGRRRVRRATPGARSRRRRSCARPRPRPRSDRARRSRNRGRRR